MADPSSQPTSQPLSSLDIPQANPTNPEENNIQQTHTPLNDQIPHSETPPDTHSDHESQQIARSKPENESKSNKPQSVYQSILMKKSGIKKKPISKSKKEVEATKPQEPDEQTKESVDMLQNLKNALFNLQTQAASYRLQQQRAQKENQTLKQQFQQMSTELQKSEKDRQKDSLYITKQEHEIAAHKLKLGAPNDFEEEISSKSIKSSIKKEESLKDEYGKKLSECNNYLNSTAFENVVTMLKNIEEVKEQNADMSSIAMHELEALEQSISIHANVTEVFI